MAGLRLSVLLALAVLWHGAAQAAEGGLTQAEARQIEARFDQAMAAIDARRYQAAIDLLDDILAEHPELLRVRLELARALFLTGEDDLRATFQFERVLAGDLPEAVRANVERFLDVIRQRRVWSLTASFAIVPDSNINSGPSSREVTIGGLPFELSETATEKSAVGAQASLAGTYRFTLSEDFRLQLGASVYQKVFDDDQYNDTIVQWSVGPRYLFRRGDAGIAFVGYHRWYGNDPYVLAAGGRLDGNYLVTDKIRLDAGVQLRDLNYHPSTAPGGGMRVTDLSDGTAFDTDLTLRYAVTPSVLAYATLLYTATDAGADYLSNQSKGVALGTYIDLPRGLSIGLSARYAVTDYDGIQPFFGKDRQDEDWQESILLLHRNFKVWGATPTFRYTRIDHSSTIEPYEYPRDLFEIGLTRQF